MSFNLQLNHKDFVTLRKSVKYTINLLEQIQENARGPLMKSFQKVEEIIQNTERYCCQNVFGHFTRKRLGFIFLNVLVNLVKKISPVWYENIMRTIVIVMTLFPQSLSDGNSICTTFPVTGTWELKQQIFQKHNLQSLVVYLSSIFVCSLLLLLLAANCPIPHAHTSHLATLFSLSCHLLLDILI